jgi:hypothetical protein
MNHKKFERNQEGSCTVVNAPSVKSHAEQRGKTVLTERRCLFCMSVVQGQDRSQVKRTEIVKVVDSSALLH